MTEQNLTPEEADQKGVNPETGEPDNPDHGTYANPIDHDYNLENLENAEEPAVEEDDSSNTVNPEPVDGTAEGADAPFGYRG